MITGPKVAINLSCELSRHEYVMLRAHTLYSGESYLSFLRCATAPLPNEELLLLQSSIGSVRVQDEGIFRGTYTHYAEANQANARG